MSAPGRLVKLRVDLGTLFQSKADQCWIKTSGVFHYLQIGKMLSVTNQNHNRINIENNGRPEKFNRSRDHYEIIWRQTFSLVFFFVVLFFSLLDAGGTPSDRSSSEDS